MHAVTRRPLPTPRPSPALMRTLRSLTAPLVALLALAAAWPGGAAAQTSSTAGAIRGRAVGAGDLPLAGVQVSAVNEGTGLTRNAVTDDAGVYVIRLLPSGTYRVAARRLGSAPSEVTGVRVVVGTTTTTNFTLQEAAVQLSTVQVTADAQRIDVADAGVKQTVSTEEIANLPSLGRDFTDFINLSGLVSPSPEATTGGQFSVAGQRPSQTNIQIDGADANNSFFGENRGGSRVPFAFSLESVKEFQVITNGYDVEYGNYSGGLINIVTKGGTNDFRGTVYGNYRGDNTTRNDFEGRPPNNFEVQQYAAQVEGPILRDRLFFFGSLDAQRRREPFRPVNEAFLRASDSPSSADSLLRFYDILASEYGVPNAAAGYEAFETTNDVLTLFGRADWNVNAAHRLSLRNNFSTYENENETFTGAFSTVNGGLSLAEVLKDKANSFVTELTSTLRPNVFNVLCVQHSFEERPRTGNELRPGLRVRLDADQSMTFGGQSLAFNNNLDESKVQLVNNLTVVLGQHSLKLGTNNTFSSFDNRFWNQGSGVYEFNSLADFEAQRPSRYTRNVPTDGEPPQAKFRTQEYSLYAQDDWQVTPRLLAQYGLRYDVARFSNRPGRVIDVERALGFETGIAPIDDDNVSPRVSLTFDRRGDATELFRVGGGYFYGRVPFVLGSNVAITEVPMRTLECTGSIADGDATAPPPIGDYGSLPASGSGNPLNCAGAGGIGGVPEYSFWTSDFEVPETFKANVGYERLLGRGTRLSFDALYSNSTKLYTVRNLNLRSPLFELEGEGGRAVFVPEAAFAPALAGGPERLRNTDFGNLFANYNDGVARSFAATVNADQRLSNNTSFRGSYTYTWAKDNSSFSCCTSFAGFSDQRYGALGPNVIGEVGDEDGGWGPSAFVRNHTFVLSGIFRLPYDFNVTTMWRIQSGTPWGPEVSADLNGDGVRFNDRPFIFRPEDLPVAVPSNITDEAEREAFVTEQRDRYAGYLSRYEDCIGEYQGRIIPRNTCRQPWFNRMDLSVRKRLHTLAGQSAELSVDLFNVLNGLNSDWGQYRAVTSASRNLLAAQSYNSATKQIEYTVPTTLGTRTQLGDDLLLQFSAQIGLRYYF